MTEQCETNYLARYEGVQAEIHQESQFDEASVVRTIYLGRLIWQEKMPGGHKSNFI